MTIHHDSHSLTRSFSTLTTNQYGWFSGNVVTPHGIVSVQSKDKNEISDSFVRFDFVCYGRLFIKTIQGKSYTADGLVTLARRFAAKCLNEATRLK